MDMETMGAAARSAARILAVTGTEQKNRALEIMAGKLYDQRAQWLAANDEDLAAARSSGMRPALIDRLTLTEKRIDGITAGVRQVAALPDPIGTVDRMETRPNGLIIGRRRVPLGVIAIIFEARPNVAVDAAALCLKSGNACILRGGKEAIRSNLAAVALMRAALREAGLPEDCICLVEDTSRESARALMSACGISTLGQQDAVFPSDITKDLGIDPYTLADIESAIRSPLRDYREQFDGALLRSDILDIKDLHIGDKLSGTVRNVVNFGAFVDIGLHDDGLVHVSRMSEKPNINPMDVVSVGDIVEVWVFDIDEERGRIALSLLPPEKLKERDERRKSGNRNKKGRGRVEPKKEEKSLNDSLKALQAKFKSL